MSTEDLCAFYSVVKGERARKSQKASKSKVEDLNSVRTHSLLD